jgi:hypothetical protein
MGTLLSLTAPKQETESALASNNKWQELEQKISNQEFSDAYTIF